MPNSVASAADHTRRRIPGLRLRTKGLSRRCQVHYRLVLFEPMANESNHGTLTRLAERVIHRVVQNSAFFYYARTHFYWGTMKRLRRTLAVEPGERLLDVGCGSGMGAGLTAGTYVGIDMDMPYLRFAHQRRQNSPTHAFARMSAFQLAFADGTFDKAMMLNLVHHL